MNYRAEVLGLVDLFSLHKHRPQRYPFLLQSVAGHPLSGRYDIHFAFPQQALKPQPGVDFFAELSRQSLSRPFLLDPICRLVVDRCCFLN